MTGIVHIVETYGVSKSLAACYLDNYVDGRSCMEHGCKYLLYCDVIHRKESRRVKEEKKMDLDKKITINLTEDDVKEIIAEYVMSHSSIRNITAENVAMEYGVKYSGPQTDRVEYGYLKECIVKG